MFLDSSQMFGGTMYPNGWGDPRLGKVRHHGMVDKKTLLPFGTAMTTSQSLREGGKKCRR